MTIHCFEQFEKNGTRFVTLQRGLMLFNLFNYLTKSVSSYKSWTSGRGNFSRKKLLKHCNCTKARYGQRLFSNLTSKIHAQNI